MFSSEWITIFFKRVLRKVKKIKSWPPVHQPDKMLKPETAADDVDDRSKISRQQVIKNTDKIKTSYI